jgi:hypothetical protein
MSSATKRTREELIAGGYCPLCGKCTASLGDGLKYCGSLYGCRKCGTLFLELGRSENPEIPHFIDVTNHWNEIQEWYRKRREEMEAAMSELEMELLAEVPGAITTILAGTKTTARPSITLVKI